MTPVSIHEGRKVVRHSSRSPSPFLVKTTPHLNQVVDMCKSNGNKPRAVDIGCGGGRQSIFLKSLGFEVLSFDRKPDYGYAIELEERPIPVFSGTVNVIVVSYVLMFLRSFNIDDVISQSVKMATAPSLIIVEMADVKNGLYHGDDLVALVDTIEGATRLHGFSPIIRNKMSLVMASSI